MTIKAWLDLQIGTGEVVKNLKIFRGKVGEFIWGPQFWFFSFFIMHIMQCLKHSSLHGLSRVKSANKTNCKSKKFSRPASRRESILCQFNLVQ